MKKENKIRDKVWKVLTVEQWPSDRHQNENDESENKRLVRSIEIFISIKIDGGCLSIAKKKDQGYFGEKLFLNNFACYKRLKSLNWKFKSARQCHRSCNYCTSTVQLEHFLFLNVFVRLRLSDTVSSNGFIFDKETNMNFQKTDEGVSRLLCVRQPRCHAVSIQSAKSFRSGLQSENSEKIFLKSWLQFREMKGRA